MPIRRINHIQFNRKIVSQELDRLRTISKNSTHLRGGQEHVLRLFGGEEALHRRLIREIQLHPVTKFKYPALHKLRQIADPTNPRRPAT